MSNSHTIAGATAAIHHVIERCTIPVLGQGSIALELLRGDDKAIVAWWMGNPDTESHTFREERGDGRFQVVRPGHPLYAVPPNIRLKDGHNIRAGVPLWLLCPGAPGRERVLALGTLHPLFNSATLDFYNSQNRHIGQFYVTDQRQIGSSYKGEGELSPTAQMERLDQMRGLPSYSMLHAPVAPGG